MPYKKYLLTGLMVWLPLAITLWVLLWLVGMLDGLLGTFLTAVMAVAPVNLIPTIERLRHIPGLGVVLVFGFMLLTGALVSNVAGRWWVEQWSESEPGSSSESGGGVSGQAERSTKMGVGRGRGGSTADGRLLAATPNPGGGARGECRSQAGVG